MSVQREAPLISVIVPIYKAERLLRKCVDSILAQRYQNIQVILIDDGSPDGSGRICDEYAEKDPRVVVKHTVNQGVSAARNEGIQLAEGEYIAFVDSDDYLSPGFLPTALLQLENSEADLFISGVVEEQYQDGKLVSSKVNAGLDKLYTVTELFNAFNVEFPFLLICGIWCKLYRTQLIKKHWLRFDIDTTFGEDMLFLCDYLKHSKQVIFSSEVFYHYYHGNPDSLFSRYYLNMFEISIPLYERMLVIMRVKGCTQEAIQRMVAVYVRVLVGCIYHEMSNQDKSTPEASQEVIRKVAAHPYVRHMSIFRYRKLKDKALILLLRMGGGKFVYRLLNKRHYGRHA